MPVSTEQQDVARARSAGDVTDNSTATSAIAFSGIAYREIGLHAQGVDFVLMPERDKHTAVDLRFAKQWLFDNRDVVLIRVQWV